MATSNVRIVPLEDARSGRSIRVLVAGTPAYHAAAAEALGSEAIVLVDHAETAEALFDKLGREDFDCIVADQTIGTRNTLEVRELMAQRFPGPPALVMLTAEGSDRTILKAFRNGVSDFVAIGRNSAHELRQAIRRSVERNRKTQVLVDEIEHLSKLARCDRLTGLPNRNFLEDRLVTMIASAERHGSPLSLFLIDVNNFRAINDIYGHAVGDQALKAFAKRLMRTARTSDTLGRFGGDEFLYMIDREVSVETAEMACGRLANALSFSIELDAIGLTLSASIGAALYPNDGAAPDELLAAAAAAMQIAKASGVGFHVARGTPAGIARAESMAAAETGAARNPGVAREPAPGHRDQNRRVEHRDRVFRSGRMILGDGFSTIDCVIRDLSSHGARVTVEDNITVPRLLSFTVLDTGRVFQATRRWQRGQSIGLEFQVETAKASADEQAA